MENVANAIREFVNNAVGVNLIEMVVQIAATLLLFLIVKHFFWNNITEYLEKRKDTMNEEYKTAMNAKEEAKLLKNMADSELKEIRLNAKGLYEDAKIRGEQERKIIVTDARTDADRIVENAHQEVVSEIEKAKKDINDEIVNVATLMAEKIIGREMDDTKHQELINEISKEVLN